MSKKNNFAPFLYVKIENEGEEDQYFYAIDSADEHAQVGEKVRIGVYKLVEVSTLSTEVKHGK